MEQTVLLVGHMPREGTALLFVTAELYLSEPTLVFLKHRIRTVCALIARSEKCWYCHYFLE